MSIISLLTSTNFKVWKENVMIVLGCMDLNQIFKKDQLSALTKKSSTKDKKNFKLWKKYNHISVMIIKWYIPKIIWDSLLKKENAKAFLAAIEKLYLKNEKNEVITILRKLISMRYSSKENIREYIIQISLLADKLKELKLEIFEDLLVALVLLSFLNQYGNLKAIYNAHKDK
ncbi:Transmembrane protein [Parasponia andersonii]|uniref:Transmembrane protein n=1 Tax=Parasponia andersonii TaxID=3476 RepID=A0A2P5C7M3_PARAD|nr:Transmembrane protein [Parasponia andersonii]